jgi:hypothetical protein
MKRILSIIILLCLVGLSTGILAQETTAPETASSTIQELGKTFGKTIGRTYGEYRFKYAWLAPVFHIGILVVLYLLIRHGNRFRRAFSLYFFLTYIWLTIWMGVWTLIKLYQAVGFFAIAMYGPTPIFLLVIAYLFFQELREPRLDLDLKGVSWWRWLIAVPVMAWGYWYPYYEYGVRFIYSPSDLLFGAYGLMGCPTTMMALSILFLKYPKGNRSLFHWLTVFTVFTGLGTVVGSRYWPDVPLLIIGPCSLGLILLNAFTRARNTGKSATQPSTV